MSSTRSRASELSLTDRVRLVTRILEGYATNGVFRGFSVTAKTPTTAKFRVVWHYDRTLELVLRVPDGTLHLSSVLPNIPSRSPMYKDLKKFVETLQSGERPDHRRIDPARARLVCSNRQGNVAVTMAVVEDEFEYATRKLIHAANEIFMIFLRDGPYSEYIQEVLGTDPDEPAR
jgi:hypothetical protein